MNNRTLLSIAAWLLLMPSTAAAAKAAPTATDLEAITQRAFAAWNVPGAAVVVVKDGTVVMSKGYGYRSLTNRQPVDANTSFYLASVTKGFTATSIQMLADKGLDIDRPAASELREFGQSGSASLKQLTIRDLLSHRTGYPRTDLMMFGGLSNSAILSRLAAVTPVARNGDRFTYQNQMYLALSEIVRRRSGMRWQDFVRSKILAPLGMRSSNADGLGRPSTVDFAVPHALIDGKIVPITYFPRQPYGGGAINSTANDMAKYLKFQLGDGPSLVSAKRFAEMHHPITQLPSAPFAPGAKHVAYGMGWFVHDYQGDSIVQHGGNGEGWTSLVWLDPKRKLGIAIMTNMHDSYLPWAISFQIADAFNGVQGDWAVRLRAAETARRGASTKWTGTGHPALLQPWSGEWVNPIYGRLSIRRRRQGMTLRYGVLDAILEPLDPSRAGAHWTRSDMTAVLGVSPVRISADAKGPILSLSVGGDDFQFRRPR